MSLSCGLFAKRRFPPILVSCGKLALFIDGEFIIERELEDCEGSVPSCWRPDAVMELAPVASPMRPPVTVRTVRGTTASPVKLLETCNVPWTVVQPERASSCGCCEITVTPPFPQELAVEEGNNFSV